jgi:predicted MFS family arabinose efflux permease
VFRQPDLRGALLTVLLSRTLCAPLLTFCAVLVKQAFGTGIGHFSLTMSAFGVGGLVGALGLLAMDPARDLRSGSSWMASGFAVVVVLAALNPWAEGLPVLFALGGLFMTASNASANAHLQSQAPVALRGQTVSLFMLAMRGGLAIGGLVTGITVSLMGVREALLLNGLLAVAGQFALRRAWLRVTRPL